MYIIYTSTGQRLLEQTKLHHFRANVDLISLVCHSHDFHRSQNDILSVILYATENHQLTILTWYRKIWFDLNE